MRVLAFYFLKKSDDASRICPLYCLDTVATQPPKIALTCKDFYLYFLYIGFNVEHLSIYSFGSWFVF